MISDEQLDRYRLDGTRLRVVRDAIEANDVVGIVVAWSDEEVMLRKRNRRIVRLSRAYRYEPASDERGEPDPGDGEG